MNNTSFSPGKDVCRPTKCPDYYNLCQKCEVTGITNFAVNGTDGSWVFMILYTIDPCSKSVEELYRYSYSFTQYHFVDARLDKFGEEYLLTSHSEHFIDGSANKTGNLVQLYLVLGFETN